jgi:uncharacterized protein
LTWTIAVLIVGGFGAGFLSGAIGIGGGLLFVPTMTVGLRTSQAIAQGTSLVAIIPTAIVGAASHWWRGNVVTRHALLMGGGGVVGAIIGAFVAVEVPGSLLGRVWGAFLLFSAYRIGLQAVRRRQKAA